MCLPRRNSHAWHGNAPHTGTGAHSPGGLLYGMDDAMFSHDGLPLMAEAFSANLEHGMGFEPTNSGFAGRRVSHFATRAQKL